MAPGGLLLVPAMASHCPLLLETALFSSLVLNGGGGLFATQPPTTKPVHGADGAHLEHAISAEAKPISELITAVLCESWGFPGDEAALGLPSVATGAGGGVGCAETEPQSSAEIVGSVASPTAFLAHSWGSCRVSCSVCHSQGTPASDFGAVSTPEGTASFAFALLQNKAGRERRAAPKLPGLKVNLDQNCTDAFGADLPRPPPAVQCHEGLPGMQTC